MRHPVLSDGTYRRSVDNLPGSLCHRTWYAHGKLDIGHNIYDTKYYLILEVCVIVPGMPMNNWILDKICETPSIT